jgi:hypothetical protein
LTCGDSEVRRLKQNLTVAAAHSDQVAEPRKQAARRATACMPEAGKMIDNNDLLI